MKKNKFILAILLVFVILSSCNDAIEIDQPGRLASENAFESVADLQQGLLAAYGKLDLTDQIRINSVFTDEVGIGKSNGGQALDEYQFVLQTNNGNAASIWLGSYDAINEVNLILEASNTIVATDAADATLLKNIKAQCYFIRAFSHFEIQSYFTTDYEDDTALGAIAIDKVQSLDAAPARSTNLEVYTLIEADLAKGMNLLDATQDADFFGEDFVIALKARMAAYRGKYTEALANAQILIDKYPLANKSQYLNMFSDLDQTEVISVLGRRVGDDYDNQGTGGGGTAGSLYAFQSSNINGTPFLEMGRIIFDKIATDDIRYLTNIDPTSLIDPAYPNSVNFRDDDVLVIKKYPGKNGTPLLNDLKVFRVSEMYFIKAEALADANDFTGAANVIKEIQDARYGTAQTLEVYSNDEEAFGAILDERQKELIFEGHRWKDLKRLGARGNRKVTRAANDCAFNSACSLEVSSFKFTLPIPLAEINGNAGIRAQQNPGY